MQKEGALSKRKGIAPISEIHVAKNRELQDGAAMGKVGKGSSAEGKTVLLWQINSLFPDLQYSLANNPV